MFIKRFQGPPLPTNTYLVADEETKKAIVIDPSKDTTVQILREAEKNNFKIIYIVNTHGHWDHITENHELKELTKAQILINKNDSKKLIDMKEQTFPFKIHPSKADSFLNDNDELKLGKLNFKILHTPGHTKGSVCLYEKNEKVLFTGDTLFTGTHGRTDFEDGSQEEMNNSLRKLAKLPKDITVYPGHGETTKIIKFISWFTH